MGKEEGGREGRQKKNWDEMDIDAYTHNALQSPGGARCRYTRTSLGWGTAVQNVEVLMGTN